MGTKSDPGRYDCYANARPDEQMFILLDRDPLAPYLVSIWSKVRMGDEEAARAVFESMLKTPAIRYCLNPDTEQASEAFECAMEMFRSQALDGNTRDPTEP